MKNEVPQPWQRYLDDQPPPWVRDFIEIVAWVPPQGLDPRQVIQTVLPTSG
jgi:hypothetical protein